MSNKIKLQNNNLALDSYITRINAAKDVAATLPNQETPEILVNASGLIMATAGTKISTHQLAFQSAKTITPGTASQVAVSSGYYTGGNITVAGDTNLVAGNIKSGVSIFGVTGTLQEGASGEDDLFDSWINGTIVSCTNNNITSLKSYIFYGCSNLTTANFPNVTAIGERAFYGCESMTSLNAPLATTIGANAFCSCKKLVTANFQYLSSYVRRRYDFRNTNLRRMD